MSKGGALVVMLAVGLAGCQSAAPTVTDAPPPETPKATDVDPQKAEPDYWLNQPAVASVTSADFDKLFDASERSARNHYFTIDQADRRSGLIVTLPATTKQFFEIWRNDSGTARGTVDSSLATHRRTVRYEFTRNGDGTFTVVPKVLVERYSTAGHRVTVPALAPNAFSPPPDESDPAYRHNPWDPTYWYATGRDTELEKQLASSIESRLR
jgi:hypothetical protein